MNRSVTMAVLFHQGGPLLVSVLFGVMLNSNSKLTIIIVILLS